jgi:hypothetical protein
MKLRAVQNSGFQRGTAPRMRERAIDLRVVDRRGIRAQSFFTDLSMKPTYRRFVAGEGRRVPGNESSNEGMVALTDTTSSSSSVV